MYFNEIFRPTLVLLDARRSYSAHEQRMNNTGATVHMFCDMNVFGHVLMYGRVCCMCVMELFIVLHRSVHTKHFEKTTNCFRNKRERKSIKEKPYFFFFFLFLDSKKKSLKAFSISTHTSSSR